MPGGKKSIVVVSKEMEMDLKFHNSPGFVVTSLLGLSWNIFQECQWCHLPPKLFGKSTLAAVWALLLSLFRTIHILPLSAVLVSGTTERLLCDGTHC